MKWMIAFDLDGTLAESKRPLSEDMAATLARLLAVTDVAVISGWDWPQFEKQVASRLPAGAALYRLWLMPTTGTRSAEHTSELPSLVRISSAHFCLHKTTETH